MNKYPKHHDVFHPPYLQRWLNWGRKAKEFAYVCGLQARMTERAKKTPSVPKARWACVPVRGLTQRESDRLLFVALLVRSSAFRGTIFVFRILAFCSAVFLQGLFGASTATATVRVGSG